MLLRATRSCPDTRRIFRIARIEFGCRRELHLAGLTVRYHNHVQELRRITIDPAVMGGKACIRGMRVTVGMIVEAMAAGRSIAELLTDFPYLEEPDIREALNYAAQLAQGREIKLAS